jgi:hypothetical protein
VLLIGQLALLLVVLRVVVALILVLSWATHGWHRHAQCLGESNESLELQSSTAEQSAKANLRLSPSLMATPRASTSVRVRLLLSAAPFNLEVMQFIPWLTAAFDGLPSVGVMALSSALSLSHGASLLLLQVWFLIILVGGGTRDAGGVLTLVILSATTALTALAFGRLGVVRSFLLWRRPSRVSGGNTPSRAPDTSAYHLRSSSSSSTSASPGGSSLLRTRPGCQSLKRAASRRVSEAALRANDDPCSSLLTEPQRYAAHLRALERQQLAARRISERTALAANKLPLDPTSGATRTTAQDLIRPMAITRAAAKRSPLHAAPAGKGAAGTATRAHSTDAGLPEVCDSVRQVGDDDSTSPIGGSRCSRVARAAAANSNKRLTRVSRARATNKLMRDRMAERLDIEQALASSSQVDQGSAELVGSAVTRLRNAKATNRVRRTRALLNGSELSVAVPDASRHTAAEESRHDGDRTGRATASSRATRHSRQR